MDDCQVQLHLFAIDLLSPHLLSTCSLQLIFSLLTYSLPFCHFCFFLLSPLLSSLLYPTAVCSQLQCSQLTLLLRLPSQTWMASLPTGTLPTNRFAVFYAGCQQVHARSWPRMSITLLYRTDRVCGGLDQGGASVSTAIPGSAVSPSNPQCPISSARDTPFNSSMLTLSGLYAAGDPRHGRPRHLRGRSRS